ncbi:hypothetical protein [Caballeronia sp. 15711]|uniref:hypothetical protein n=1 Tax=Caballeronia sp. 15711 TaxID=3391029 RepID=UPI0039E3AF5A
MATGAAHSQEIYVQGGTLGAGIGAAYSFNSWSGVHAEVGGFGLSHSFTVDDNKYDGHLSLKQGGLYLDLFPFSSSGFRVTGGALFNGDKLTGHAVPDADGNYKIGNDLVPAVGPAPSATVRLPSVMPYLGVGYGHKPVSKGFGFMCDLGVAYGRPHVSYSVPAIYSQLTTQANIDQEQQNITDHVERYRWYPVVQVGVTYRF